MKRLALTIGLLLLASPLAAQTVAPQCSESASPQPLVPKYKGAKWDPATRLLTVFYIPKADSVAFRCTLPTITVPDSAALKALAATRDTLSTVRVALKTALDSLAKWPAPAPTPTPTPTPVPTPTPAPAPGPNAMYFNSAEPCTTDPNALFCDDFEDGDWYSKDCDQANSSGGLLQTDGWCGNIYANPITPAKAAVCGGKGYRSNCAATSGDLSGQQGRNMADHSYLNNVRLSDAYFRLYFQPQADYNGGHEKMFDFTTGGSGSAQMLALCYNRDGQETIHCISYRYQDNGLAGCTNYCWMDANQSAGDLTLQRGHWYYFEMHAKLNTPGQYDGVFEWWLNDCGTASGTGAAACPGSPTLRGRYTTVRFRDDTSTLSGNWIENWANPGSQGTLLYDNIRAGKAPIGF